MADKKEIKSSFFPNELFIVGNAYSKKDIGFISNSKIYSGSGVAPFSNCLLLFVTLDKENKPELQKYKDFFKNRKEFFWESQYPGKRNNFGSPNKPLMKSMLNGEIKSYLFARRNTKTKSKPSKFIYCGELKVESFDSGANDLRPFGVKFITKEIPKIMPRDLKELVDWKPYDQSSTIEAEYLAIAQPVTKEIDLNDKDGQGRLTNQRLKDAIENYAMDKAFEYYKSKGYLTFDDSRKKLGYDIRGERPGSTKYVEVKGTKNDGWCVFVTKKEVEFAKSKPVDLFIVNKIEYKVIEENFDYECQGGELRILSPWKPNSSKSSLKVIDYKFCPEK